ncbi:hypothetical protein A6V36_20455 [Paraburkholderia ginsengiterrae]|uniref:Uncharacterized protein n=1 Tax=Paraburkholderia ginsengiterrae TaxID=1462993 RepID=A0A1A9NE44_9BURK|nr:hypothetical protein [Paraburkholderia ginsengiterrae]OAJ62747.1 hypothetical protein A6V36_20455 [Paraburkholderia ginsengiterrae]OAJ64408.1 hypothetical protein A6V37_19480 [Paraburkholderia ginsengiterrae]
MNAIEEYDAALERLRSGDTIRVPVGTRITNDAVSTEAGRGKGSIKKNRKGFDDLIRRIKEATQEQKANSQVNVETDVSKHNTASNQYFRMYQESLARELSLLYENQNLKEERVKLKSTIEKLNADLAELKRSKAPSKLHRVR